jgi:hypothetical protein
MRLPDAVMRQSFPPSTLRDIALHIDSNNPEYIRSNPVDDAQVFVLLRFPVTRPGVVRREGDGGIGMKLRRSPLPWPSKIEVSSRC